jgi:outer membrane protein assembly factor BamB
MAEEQVKQGWIKSRAFFWLSVFLVPPLALVLLWWQRRTGIIKRILASLVLAVMSAVWVLVLLVTVFGLRAELSGSGESVIFTFASPQDDVEQLELHRQARQAEVSEAQVVVPEESVVAAWPHYRGPHDDGSYDEMPVNTSWPETGLTPLWQQPVGGGYASFAIAGGVAFTVEQRRDQEVVVAYQLRTGHEVWSHGWQALFEESTGGNGPRATPTWHDGRLYALGAEGELRALTASTGELLWRCNILEDAGASNIEWGMAASPLVSDDAVIVLPGGGDGKSVAAYHRLTGELLWHALDDRQSYTTPMVVDMVGIRQLLVVSAERALGLSLDGSTLLWHYPWVTDYECNAAQPLIIGDERFVISAGYGHGAALVHIAAGEDGITTETVWETKKLRNRFSSSVSLDGHVYGLDEPTLVCIDVATGERLWKGKRYGNGQLLLADRHLIVLGEKGQLALVEARPDSFNEVASFQAIEGKTWNLPAIGEGILLVRNHRMMAAFEVTSK